MVGSLRFPRQSHNIKNYNFDLSFPIEIYFLFQFIFSSKQKLQDKILALIGDSLDLFPV